MSCHTQLCIQATYISKKLTGVECLGERLCTSQLLVVVEREASLLLSVS